MVLLEKDHAKADFHNHGERFYSVQFLPSLGFHQHVEGNTEGPTAN